MDILGVYLGYVYLCGSFLGHVLVRIRLPLGLSFDSIDMFGFESPILGGQYS